MLRPDLTALPASRIREVANAGIGRTDVLKFWFGEGDQPTPTFIRDAAKAALDAGDTFYAHNLGLAELRQSVVDYLNRLHAPRVPLHLDRVAITSAGVNALAVVCQALLSPGDRVAIVTPVWPNLTSLPPIMGARVVRVPLDVTHGRWRLDLDRLLDALAGCTMVVVNSPNNPTGWTMTQPQWDALRARCVRDGIWIVSDDAYERLVYDEPTGVAPGLLAQVDDGERYVSANTFSKAWSMTGWRLGWLAGPSALIDGLARIIEFNTSCAPSFVQRAGLAALAAGEPVVAETRARMQHARDRLVARLACIPDLEVAAPAGAMYLFFRLAAAGGDSLSFAKHLVTAHGLGLAPGMAFGPEGEGALRWCFAASDALLDAGAERLAAALRAHPGGGRG